VVPSTPGSNPRAGKPDAPAVHRRYGPASKQLAYEVFHPGTAVAQALQQSHIGKVCEAGRSSPGARGSKPHAAEAIGRDQPEQIGGGLDPPWTHKGPYFAGGGLNRSPAAKPRHRCLPKFVQKRFVSHAMLESDSIPHGKPYVSAYAMSRGRRCGKTATAMPRLERKCSLCIPAHANPVIGTMVVDAMAPSLLVPRRLGDDAVVKPPCQGSNGNAHCHSRAWGIQ
jgi:hypothetical protein